MSVRGRGCGLAAAFLSLVLGTQRAVAQADGISVVGGTPAEVMAGMALRPAVTVHVAGARAGLPVHAFFSPSFARPADGDSALTDANGDAQFPGLAVWGPSGNATLTFRAGSQASSAIPIAIKPGIPARVVVVGQPFATTDVETLTVSASTVRVVDLANNPVPGARVTVSPSYFPPGEAAGPGEHHNVSLIGSTRAATNEQGEVTFDSLKVLGPKGQYALLYTVDMPGMSASVFQLSDTIGHDPDHNSNQSFVVVSAIKSIAGVVPQDEFFDVRFRYRYGWHFFGLAQLDVGLTGKGDSVQSSQKLLTEASVSLNWDFVSFTDTYSRRAERSLFGGVTGVVFNTLPYVGVQVGSIEHAGSALQGSSFVFATLFRASRDTNFVGSDTLVAAPFSLYGGFFLRSTRIDFFKTLNIRGGILLPFDLSTKRGRLQSRLVIAIPVGTINFF